MQAVRHNIPLPPEHGKQASGSLSLLTGKKGDKYTGLSRFPFFFPGGGFGGPEINCVALDMIFSQHTEHSPGTLSLLTDKISDNVHVILTMYALLLRDFLLKFIPLLSCLFMPLQSCIPFTACRVYSGTGFLPYSLISTTLILSRGEHQDTWGIR